MGFIEAQEYQFCTSSRQVLAALCGCHTLSVCYVTGMLCCFLGEGWFSSADLQLHVEEALFGVISFCSLQQCTQARLLRQRGKTLSEKLRIFRVLLPLAEAQEKGRNLCCMRGMVSGRLCCL